MATEAKANKSDVKVRLGQAAVFGNIYQVYCPGSDQFVQAEKTVAKEDDTAMQCSLAEDKDRSKMMYFRLMPGFPFRNEGDEQGC